MEELKRVLRRAIGSPSMPQPPNLGRYRSAAPLRPRPVFDWPPIRRAPAPAIETVNPQVRFQVTAPAADILNSLRSNGIAVVDNFMNREQTGAADIALRSTFSQENCDLIPAAHGSQMILLRGRHLQASKEAHRSFAYIAGHSLIKAAGHDFFGDADWTNTSIYGLVYLDERRGDVHYHIDPSACLKALVYVTDVASESDGPFFLDVGSHREGYYRMMTHYYEGAKRAFEIPEEEIRAPAKVLGKAGTCILFNSILIHRAGEVARGHSRVSLTYFFDRPYANDADMNIPPYLYSFRHQSEERPYIQG